MPPKKLKDLSSAPVYGMAHEQQVRLLSDALLREYMHRRGYLATLKAFDEENPRDAETISSRALMADLMAIDAGDQQRLKSEGIETIMEMLCDLRVEKRMTVEALQSEAARPLPDAPTEQDISALESAVEESRARAQRSKGKPAHKHRSSSSSSGKAEKSRRDKGEGKAGQKRKPKKKTTKKKSGGGWDPFDAAPTEDGVTLADLIGSSDDTSSSGGSGSDSDEKKRQADNGASAAAAPSRPAAGGGGKQDGERAGEDSSKQSKKPLAPKANVSFASPQEGNHSGSDEESGEEDGASAAVPGGGGVEGGKPLDAATAESVCRLLFGRSAQMPPLSFLQQGFVYDDNNLEYALVQWRRGPGAVLAVVQSLVISHFYEKEVYVNVKTRQLDGLRRALAAILFRAQPDPVRVVLVNGTLSARKPQKSFAERLLSTPSSSSATGAAFHVWRDFTSTEEVEDALKEFLPGEEEQWLAGKSCGLLCFLLSLCLSRGVEAVRRDMSSSGSDATCLVEESTGDGTKELLHLALTGRATANAQPRGVGSQPVGLLDGDRPTHADADADESDSPVKALTTASALLNPGYPSWVVHHRGHYSNLFMKKDTRRAFRQKQQLSGSASAEVFYWDPLTEDDEFALTVDVTAVVAGQRRRTVAGGSSFVTAAVHAVPDWAKATVDWNGASPPK